MSAAATSAATTSRIENHRYNVPLADAFDAAGHSDSPRSLRPMPSASGWLGRTMKIFPLRRGCSRPGCGRTSRPCTRLPARQTISPTRGGFRPRSGSGCLTTGSIGCTRVVLNAVSGRSRTSRATMARSFSRWAPRSAPVVFPSRCSTICSARFVRISRCIGTTRGTRVLDYCRRSANPVGRLVLAHWRVSTIPNWIDRPTRSARRFS